MGIQMDLKGRSILITGASKGLGAVCARALSECGARMALMARTKEKLEEVRACCAESQSHVTIAADLTDPVACLEAVVQAQRFLGDIDVVLHAAGGGLGLHDPLLAGEDLWTLFRLNVGIAAQINRIVCPAMKTRRRGNLVHVCSIASSEATGSVGYNTVKAALAGYVRTLGRQMAASGVIVTGILPGGFYAPGNSFARMKERDPAGYKDFIEKRLPRQAIGQAEELVPMVLLLCSDQASMMGGCLVPIDAGEGRAYLNHE